MIYWDYANAEVQAAGSLPLERLEVDYGRPADSSNLRGSDLQRAYVDGRKVRPSDCPPVRVISRYGFMVRCPGTVTIERIATRRWREFEDNSSCFGDMRVSGARWPEGDSGFVASWISGADFAKIHTGIRIYFPASEMLYMGPIPNLAELSGSPVGHAVMAGVEYGHSDRSIDIQGQKHCISTVNVIVKIPEEMESAWTVHAGEPLACLMSVPKQQAMAQL